MAIRRSIFTEHIHHLPVPSLCGLSSDESTAKQQDSPCADSAIDLSLSIPGGSSLQRTSPLLALHHGQIYDEIIANSVDLVLTHLPVWRLLHIYAPFFHADSSQALPNLLAQGQLRSAISQLDMPHLAATVSQVAAAQSNSASRLWQRMSSASLSLSCRSYTSAAIQRRAVHSVLKRTGIPVTLVRDALDLYLAHFHAPPPKYASGSSTPSSSFSANCSSWHPCPASVLALATNKHWDTLAHILHRDLLYLSAAPLTAQVNELHDMTGLVHDDFLHALQKCKSIYFAVLLGRCRRCGCSYARGKVGKVEYRLRRGVDPAFEDGLVVSG